MTSAASATHAPVPLHGETVHLLVMDPEVVDEIRRHAAGEARDRFVAEALRIGVLALRTSGGPEPAHAGPRPVREPVVAR